MVTFEIIVGIMFPSLAIFSQILAWSFCGIVIVPDGVIVHVVAGNENIICPTFVGTNISKLDIMKI